MGVAVAVPTGAVLTLAVAFTVGADGSVAEFTYIYAVQNGNAAGSINSYYTFVTLDGNMSSCQDAFPGQSFGGLTNRTFQGSTAFGLSAGTHTLGFYGYAVDANQSCVQTQVTGHVYMA